MVHKLPKIEAKLDLENIDSVDDAAGNALHV
jgi:hypothetical protein